MSIIIYRMRIHQLIGIFPVITCSIYCLYSCSQTEKAGNIRFNKIKKEMRVPLTSEEDAPTCTISIAIDEVANSMEKAQCINEEIRKAVFDNNYRQSLGTAIDSFCNKSIASYKRNLENLYKADQAQNIESTWYDYRYDITSEYEYGATNCLCYRITDIRYEGGIHEVKHVRLLNFDTETGQKLVLEDIFQPSYPTMLHPLLMKELQNYFHCNTVNGLHEKGILRLTDIYIPENYTLDKAGITFLYNADEIAPYETGAIALHISQEELKPIIKKEYKDLWN